MSNLKIEINKHKNAGLELGEVARHAEHGSIYAEGDGSQYLYMFYGVSTDWALLALSTDDVAIVYTEADVKADTARDARFHLVDAEVTINVNIK